MTYLLKPCRSIAAYTSVPKKNLKLELAECKVMLEKAGYDVIDAKVMLVAKKATDITIYQSGKLLLNTSDRELARKLMEEVYEILGVET